MGGTDVSNYSCSLELEPLVIRRNAALMWPEPLWAGLDVDGIGLEIWKWPFSWTSRISSGWLGNDIQQPLGSPAGSNRKGARA
jgi:hypothetical protein